MLPASLMIQVDNSEGQTPGPTKILVRPRRSVYLQAVSVCG